MTRVSSLGKKLTVAPFTQNCRHSNGEAIHRCAGGRCFPSYDSTRYQPPRYICIYIYIHTYILTRRVHPLVYLSPRLTIHPHEHEQRSPPTGRKLGYHASEYLRVPPNFRRILIPFHLSSSLRLATLCHTSYMFSFLSFPADTETTVCDPLVICATSGSYFDVGARGFADARHRKSSPLTMQIEVARVRDTAR